MVVKEVERDVHRIVASMHDYGLMNPHGSLIDSTSLTSEDLDEISELMSALAAWKAEELEQSKVSGEDMNLSQRDMRALRFILAGERAGLLVTPVMVGHYLELTSAAVTKLLDRLQDGGHLERSPHPTDRRAIVLTLTPPTRESARSQVGALHARRFAAASRLSSTERQTVVRFLTDLADSDPRPAPGVKADDRD